jgi:hypothetical protein
MHGYDQGHGRLLRSKSVLYAAFAKTITAPIQATQLKLDEETRWQIAGEAVAELRRYGGWKELDEEAPMRPLAKG